MALIVLAAGAAGGTAAWLLRRVVRFEILRRHHEVGGLVFLQLGVIYAVLLAFVFSEVWTEYNTAANAINQECAHLHGAAILAASLPSDRAEPVETAVIEYITTVLEQEWPEMGRRRGSAAATLAFRALWLGAAGLAARDPAEGAVRGQMLAELGSAHQWRQTRLFEMTLLVPNLVWGLLVALGLILVVFLLGFGIEYVGSQVAVTAVFAAAMAFVLVLVACLDEPFAGSLRLPPESFQTTLQKVTALRTAVGGTSARH